MKQPFASAAYEHDVVVVGGAGHVGLPVAIAFASRGLRVAIFDVNETSVATVNGGSLPFLEAGALEPLREALSSGTLSATTDSAVISGGECVVVVVGTPVDEHLNPDPDAVPRALADVAAHFRDGQLIVLRSTVYPGVTRRVENMLLRSGLAVDVAFCPERIAEGQAMTELFELPQLVAARSAEVRQRAASLFGKLTNSIVELEPEEAELAKLFTNTWRYIKFAAANQFFMMANNHGLDYETIRRAITHDYPRAADLAGAGFAAGPCLFKDTMQLAAFSDNNFALGHSAMLVNEGLPLYLVSRLEEQYDLATLKVGILGMAFKGESDDTRSSLAYKLQRILRFRADSVLATDPFVTSDQTLLPLERVLSEADLLIVAAPHNAYRDLDTSLPVVDIWNLLGQGTRV
ncbi:MAG: UDP-N-acetyl-D-mannosaminuronic acid dehydrogenase [Actinomycetota bacterium]|nr:UDP-N-acetyl-D-mannosaminuronic acid dehydrogenase [Actinomycetota bacterium]